LRPSEGAVGARRGADAGRQRQRRAKRSALALALATLAAVGCSPTRLVVVDPAAGVDGNAPDVQPPGLLDGVVGYWRLDDGPGSAGARDGSGRGNNGALVSLNATTVWVPARSGLGLLINGTGWVVVPTSASIDSITDGLTVAGWIYLDGTIDLWATMLSRQVGSTIEQHYHLSLNPDRRPNLFLTTASRRVVLSSPDPVVPRTWVHLAATYDGATTRLYVDGTLTVSMPITGDFEPDTTPVILGGNGNDATGVPTELFPGRIDEIMLYRRALSADEIVRLHAGELFSTPATTRDAATD
jgi:hypothetical protein